MSDRSSERGAGAVLATALLLLLAVAAVFAVAHLVRPETAPLVGEALRRAHAGDAAGAIEGASDAGALPWLAILFLGPLAIAIILALVGGVGAAAPSGGAAKAAVGARDADAAKAPPAPPPSPDAGLRLLAALQEDARLIDFIREDISGYGDDQVGSAVRGIHAALRKAIDARMALEPILPGEDGDTVEVPPGFDPAAIRVTGSPSGEPPYRGVLRHGGWRARDPRLPVPTAGSDPTILMPAEVEVG